MSLTSRLSNPDRRQDDLAPLIERRGGEERREPFVAPWRRRQIDAAGGDRFKAVVDLTEAA
jgi:hypothetical protein